ncbi:MAG: histidine--tRNA ligase [Clostridiales bacterium]|jgi:histidyl-tRNA synthetase|nr:histidine--tRNA ligase [Clostridiales bacterium]
MNIIAPKGTKDILGDEVYTWQKIEEGVARVCKLFSIEEIRTPIFEHTELFSRGVGEATDVVQKEMYTFVTKGEKSLTLKPEGTAGVVRAYLEHGLYVNKQPSKFYYVAPNFRYEQPQSGRYRQFHQFGVEYFGSASPACDAEVISVADMLIKNLGIKNTTLYLNTLGGSGCRKKYNEALVGYLRQSYDRLCPTCKSRFEKNPLRVLDCKEGACQPIIDKAPSTLDTLGPECRNHFEQLQEILTAMGIEFKINTKIVRGLDYYTRTVFEFVTDNIHGSIGGGGRYDGLVSLLGGAQTPAAGFAMGIERLCLALLSQNINIAEKPKCDIYIGAIGGKGFLESQKLVHGLRQKGLTAESDIISRSVKAQMKYADKLGAKYSVIIGDDEIVSGKVKIKNMSTSETGEIDINEIFGFIKSKDV